MTASETLAATSRRPNGHTAAEGVSCESCSGRFTPAGLKKHGKHCQPERDHEVVRRYGAGDLSHRQVALAMGGLPPTLVLRILDRQGVERRPPGRDVRQPLAPVADNDYGPHPHFDGRCKHLEIDDGTCERCIAVEARVYAA
jgi:hypothetical protein